MSGDIRTAESYAGDQYSQVTVTSTQLTGGQWIGPMVRAQNNGLSAYVGTYSWNNGSPNLRLFKRSGGNGGTWTQLGSTYNSGALSAGAQLEVVAAGSTVSFLLNGVTRISATDTSLTGGAPGIMSYGTGQVDNWSGGNYATYSVGGTVSGLSGTVVLQDNGGDNLSVSANGSFTFATPLAAGAGYGVTVKTNPSGQACTVSNGSGTIGSANVTNVAVSCVNASTYSVGGTVSGLSGTVVLQDNGGDNLSVSANGGFTFATALAPGTGYSVTVKTNPSGQACTISNGSGTIGSANVTNVAVSCATNTATSASDDFNRADGGLGPNWTDVSDGGLAITSQAVAGTAGGAVSGDIRTAGTYAGNQYSQVTVTSTQLTGGQWIGPMVRAQNGGFSAYVGIYNWNNGSPNLMLFKRSGGNGGTWTQLGGTYNSGPLSAGAQLEVTAIGSTVSFVLNGVTRISATDTSLTGGAPGIMSYGTGQVDNWSGGNYATYSVGGTVSGLSGTVVLQDNGGDNLSVAANGSFTFATPLAAGAAYSVTVKTNPSGQACTISNGSGTIGSANVTNVAVSCANVPTYSVGGTVSGLSGTVVLQDNGGDNLSVSVNGGFTFATPLAAGAAYSVTVKTNPSGQACTVSNGSGTIGSANVTNVAVSCVNASTYSVGGTVSGLSGTVVLQDNGGDNLSVSANGGFTFATPLVSGAGYSVTVKTNPSGQACTVSNGSGTIGSANVTNVAVSCTASTATSASDDFSRADGSLGPNWTNISDGGLAITSQAVAGTAAAGVSGDIRTAETYASDQYSQVTVTSTQLTAGQWIGPMVRAQNSGQSAYVGIYNWSNGNPVLMLFERSGSNWTQLGSTYNSGPLSAGAQLEVTAIGSTISFLLNGVTRISATDTSLTGGAPGIMSYGTGQVDNWSGASITVTSGIQVNYLSTDPNGVASYQVFSPDDGYGPQIVRVLRPTNPAPGVPHNFLYVLPVEPGLNSNFGDGLETLRSLDAQDQYNLTIIEPTFGTDPWYADNPNDPNVQYETFMTKDLVPWVTQNLATTGTEQNWLIGFSKSGIGGQDLILKHPGTFALAASWDFPADMSSYNQFGSDSAAGYGTDANFQANYRLTTAFVDSHKAPFLANNRIWIGGYSLYQTDDSDYDTLLTSEGILHSTETPTGVAHRWDSGWVPQALAALYQDSRNLH